MLHQKNAILIAPNFVSHRGVQVATRYYSYSVLRRWLNTLMANFFGMET